MVKLTTVASQETKGDTNEQPKKNISCKALRRKKVSNSFL